MQMKKLMRIYLALMSSINEYAYSDVSLVIYSISIGRTYLSGLGMFLAVTMTSNAVSLLEN